MHRHLIEGAAFAGFLSCYLAQPQGTLQPYRNSVSYNKKIEEPYIKSEVNLSLRPKNARADT